MQTEIQKKKFLIVSILPQLMTDEEAFQEIKELKELVEAEGGEVVEYVVQHRESNDRGLYIGRGKIAEIAEIMGKKHVDVVVLNEMIKPGQLFTIKNILIKKNPDVKVWDRVELILNIFSPHANTAEARLQIELASMNHMGPRIYGMGHVMSRQGGGTGTRGVGETNTELMKRHWSKQIKNVKDKLKKLTLERERQLERRREIGFETASIVGYTNAGKTSLFNLLTGKNNIVNNALFVTLDSSVGNIKLPKSKRSVLLSDTIGFIRKLPTALVDAFASTLLESMHADILLHVIDATDENMRRKINSVETILKQLRIKHIRHIYVFNKTELLTPEQIEELKEKYRYYHPQFISVKQKTNIDKLLEEIENFLDETPEEREAKNKDLYAQNQEEESTQ